MAIAASFFAPADAFTQERIRVLARTPVAHFSWDDFSAQEEPWQYVPELVTKAQVRALDELLALPFGPELRLNLSENE
jgi:hypothetical protein